jgi:predicted lipoprotein
MPNNRAKAVVLRELESHFHVRAGLPSGSWLLWPLWAFWVGCAPVPLADGERRVALRETTERVILPTYTELSERASELSGLLDDLASAPGNADLSEVRRAYLATREPLEESEAFGFGPATELHAQAGLNQGPTDTVKVDAELESDRELSVSHVRSLGANKRGLHAIEYLIFPEGDAELEAALLADDVAGERRRQFLSAAGQIVALNAEQLLAAWQPENADYAGRFSRPGEPDSVASNVQAGLDTLLNETVVLSEVVANVKLGKPLGVTSGGKVDPSAQESERAGASLSDVLANLRGMRNIYLATRDGTRATSLSSLVHAKSPATDVRARTAFDDAEAAVRAIPEPFTSALNDSPADVTRAYEAIKVLKRVLATEVLGTLGASLKFSDNDGD